MAARIDDSLDRVLKALPRIGVTAICETGVGNPIAIYEGAERRQSGDGHDRA